MPISSTGQSFQSSQVLALFPCLDIVKGNRKLLFEYRTKSKTSFGGIYDSVISLSDEIGVKTNQPRIPSGGRYRALPLSMTNDVLYYRLNVFITKIDEVLAILPSPGRPGLGRILNQL